VTQNERMPQALLVTAVALLLVVMGMTALGATRRGRGALTALVAGMLFPVTWTAWYVVDERPYRRVR
jgi:hypothetical protein